MNNMNIEEHYHVEIIRKAIHLCSLSIPIVYFYVPKTTALTILVPMTLAFLLVDVARYYHRSTADWFYSAFRWLLRSREQDTNSKRLNGATYVLLSATLCVLVFPKFITVVAFSILIISDITAALVGRRFGRRPFLKKTAEGSLAFFLSAIVVVLLTPKIEHLLGEYVIGMASAAVGAIIEAASISIDDNLTIPVAIGVTMWLLYSAFYPSLDLMKFDTML